MSQVFSCQFEFEFLAVLPEPSFPSDTFSSETDTTFTEITDEGDDAFNDDLDDDEIEQKPPLRFNATKYKLFFN